MISCENNRTLLGCIGGRAHLRSRGKNGNQEKDRNNSNLRHKYRIVFSGKGGAQSNKLLCLFKFNGINMNRVKIIRKGNGDAYKDKKGRFVFVKEGVHFALSDRQMDQICELIQGLKDRSMLNIDPDSPDMAKGD